MKLHLIDGTYELFRSHFGAPPRTAPDGMAIGAVNGLASSLLALLRRDDVTHVACATDHVVESFRNDLYDGYKRGDSIEPELFAQFPVAEEAMRALGLVVWPMVAFEADDALATAAERYRAGFDAVVVASPDKDLSQCVRGSQVVQWDRRKDVTFDEDGVRAKFGVSPTSIPDYLALVGDKADGFPGLKGWGAKSASAVLAHYGTVEAIPLDEATWPVAVRGSKRLAASLRDGQDEVRLYKELATLRLDVPIEEKASDLRWRGASREAWPAFCERYGLGRLAERPHHWA